MSLDRKVAVKQTRRPEILIKGRSRDKSEARSAASDRSVTGFDLITRTDRQTSKRTVPFIC